jgi:hypothetical protein
METKGAVDTYFAGGGTVEEMVRHARESVPECETNAQREGLAKLRRDWVYIRDIDVFLERRTGNIKTKTAFLTAVANQRARNSDGMPKPLGSLFIEDADRPEADSITFLPSEPLGITADRRYNANTGWPVKPEQGDTVLFDRLLDHVFGHLEAGKEMRRWFLSWVTHMIRNRGCKAAHGFIAVGATGTGKSILGEVIGVGLFGDEQSAELDQADLDNPFNPWVRNTLFACVNEAARSDRRAQAEQLKNLITRRRVTVNIKNQSQYSLVDHINWYLTSNSPDALYLDDDDRRWAVWEVTGRLDPELGNAISQWLGLRQIQASSETERSAMEQRVTAARAAMLYRFLHEEPIDPNYGPFTRAPENQARANMISAGRSDVDAFVQEFIEDVRLDTGKKPSASDLILPEQLAEMYDEKHKRRPANKTIISALRKCGALSLGQTRVGKQRYRLWAINRSEYWARASHDERAMAFATTIDGYYPQPKYGHVNYSEPEPQPEYPGLEEIIISFDCDSRDDKS